MERAAANPDQPEENTFSTVMRAGLLRIAGFAAIVLLLFAGYESYRLLLRDSDPEYLKAKQSYSNELDLLIRIRNFLNQSPNATRNYLLSWKPDRKALYQKQLSANRGEAQRLLGELDRSQMVPPASAAELRRLSDRFLDTLDEPLRWNDGERFSQSLGLFTQEIPVNRQPAIRLIKELTDSNEVKRKELESRHEANRFRSLRNLMAMISATFLLLLGTGYILTWNARDLGREQSRRLDEAERHERDLEQLSGRLVAMQENERKALSRELHDGIGQVLAALRVEISHLGSASSPADGQACLERAYSLSDDAIRSVRNIALLLRPSILDDLGLQAALRGQAKDFTMRTGIRCEVSAEDFPDTLPDALRTCVYRVAQEALNNCQKHSSASNVHVRLRVVGKGFQLVVEDDGVGFQVAANGNSPRRMGLGMIGMRERAVNLGGSLAVHSMLGHGTRISLTLPCEPANQLVNWGSEPRC